MVYLGRITLIITLLFIAALPSFLLCGCAFQDESERALPVIYVSGNGNESRPRNEGTADKISLNNIHSDNLETENETVLPEQAEGETDDLSKKQQSDEETDDLSKKQQSADESDDLSDEQNSSDAEEPTEEYDWVDELKVSSSHDEIITVAAAGSSATVSMHVKGDDGHFRQILSGSASIGKNGIGKEREGDKKTPRGILGIQFAFGIKDNPGTALDYIKLDGDDYWVDDPASAYYNRLVSSADVTVDWNSAEHMIDAAGSYNYALATDYNSSCVPGDGSAIFMHCRPTGGAGCIAVDESLMKEILKNIHPGCVLIVDSEDEMLKY